MFRFVVYGGRVFINFRADILVYCGVWEEGEQCTCAVQYENKTNRVGRIAKSTANVFYRWKLVVSSVGAMYKCGAIDAGNVRSRELDLQWRCSEAVVQRDVTYFHTEFAVDARCFVFLNIVMDLRLRTFQNKFRAPLVQY